MHIELRRKRTVLVLSALAITATIVAGAVAAQTLWFTTTTTINIAGSFNVQAAYSVHDFHTSSVLFTHYTPNNPLTTCTNVGLVWTCALAAGTPNPMTELNNYTIIILASTSIARTPIMAVNSTSTYFTQRNGYESYNVGTTVCNNIATELPQGGWAPGTPAMTANQCYALILTFSPTPGASGSATFTFSIKA